MPAQFEECWKKHGVAHLDAIGATVLHREMAARDHQGRLSHLRTHLQTLRRGPACPRMVRFETERSQQRQADRGEEYKGSAPLRAFCVTLRFSRPAS
jgi:transposase